MISLESERRIGNYSPSFALGRASDILSGKTDLDKERSFLKEQLAYAVEDKNELVAVPIIAVFKRHGAVEDFSMLESYTENSTEFIAGVAQRAIEEIEERTQS